MPSTTGLKLLVRKSQLTNKDWIALVEARQKFIKPHLDSFTLIMLGQLECLRMEHYQHDLALDGPSIQSPEGFSLETQGIFRIQPFDAIEYFPNTGHRPGRGGIAVPDGIKRIWGLTRAGSWVVAKVSFVGQAGYKERGRERATNVEIRPFDLAGMIAETKESPQRIFTELGMAVKRWEERRRQLHNEARRLCDQFEIEAYMLSLIDSGKE